MSCKVPERLEKPVVVSLKSKSDGNVRRSPTSGIGKNCRQLLSSVFVAAVLCIADGHWPTFAQSPLQLPLASQAAQQSQSARRSRIQAPAPRSIGSTPSRTATSTTHTISAAPAEYSEQQIHVYPKSLAAKLGHSAAAELSHPNDTQPAGTASELRSGHSSAFLQPSPQVTGSPDDLPLHVYPDGVKLNDIPPKTVTNAQPLNGRFIGMQEVFAPPAGAPHIPSSGTGGHSDFMEVMPSLTLPEVAVSPDMMETPAIVTAPDTADKDVLLWWEDDLTKNILRGRKTHPLTLPQALGLALTEAPELQVLHSDWFIQQIEVDRQDAAFDWTTFVNSIWNRDSTPVGSLLDGATNRLRNRTLSAAAGLRRLNRDGSEFEISQTIGTRSSNSTLITPNYQGNSRLGFEYQKPLMQGAGEEYNTSRVQLAAIDKDTAFDRFQIGVQDHLLLVANTYWTLVLRRGRFVQSVNSWNRAKEIEQEMASRVEVDVTPTMLDRTRSEVSTRLAAAIQAEHDVFAAQDALLRLIYGAKYPQYAGLEVVTVTLPMKDGSQIAPEAQIESAIQSRSEIHESIRQIKTASIRYNIAANEVLPVLDMVLTGYVAGLDGDYDIASAFGDQFTEGEPGVGIGFDFEIPYRNRAAEAAAEQGMIAIKRMKAQLETTIGEVTEDVRGQVNERNKHGAMLPQQWETLARTKRILEHTQVRRDFLADGVEVADLYLENLLLMQSRLEGAEFAYLQSQVRFSLADTSLLRSISKLDTIAERDGVACSACQTGVVEADAPQTGVINATMKVPEFTHPSQVTAASARQPLN